MFTNLIASRPTRERRWGAWLIAGGLHLVLLYIVVGLYNQSEPDTLEIFHNSIIKEPPVLVMTSHPRTGQRGNGDAVAPPVTRISPRAPMNVSAPNAIRAKVQDAPPALPVDLAAPAGTTSLIVPRAHLFVRSPAAARSEAVRHRIEERLQPLVDSTVAAHAAAARAKEWTIGDDESRWGISPGKIHVGGKTVGTTHATGGAVAPDMIVPPPGRRDETNARVRGWQEIQLQANRAEARATFESRVREIRARNQGKTNSPLH